MLLAIDVGNTSMTLGLFRGKRLVAHGRIATASPRTVPQCAGALRQALKRMRATPADLQDAIVSSVVPQATRLLKPALKKLLRRRPIIVGETVKAPIRNRYRIPSQVGQDRLVNAVGAYTLYGGPAIVVDFGTAITIDLVSGRREYLGGLIVPGMEIALETLSARAALLPRIRLERPKEFLGRDTVGSMKSGIFHGYSALCDGVVRRLKSKHAPKARVVGTGGHVVLIAPYCRTIQIVNPYLTLQGLQIVYKNSFVR